MGREPVKARTRPYLALLSGIVMISASHALDSAGITIQSGAVAPVS